jgi:SAM-dependent methyltransferase
MITTPANWFEEWFNSPYYHKLYFERDNQAAADFIDRLIGRLQPAAGSRMVDVACGRGRHAIQLAGKGFDVTGIDLAADPIAIARQSETDNLHFFVHDMRLPFWVNYFDYAFSLFTSFGYFRTEREHYNAIRTIAGSLTPGGMLVLDYLNVHYAENHLVPREEKQMDEVSFQITRWFDETHFYKKIIIEDARLETQLEYTEKVAKFSLGDLNDMFAFHGLQLQDVYGDYQFNSYDVKHSPALIMVVKKK